MFQRKDFRPRPPIFDCISPSHGYMYHHLESVLDTFYLALVRALTLEHTAHLTYTSHIYKHYVGRFL